MWFYICVWSVLCESFFKLDPSNRVLIGCLNQFSTFWHNIISWLFPGWRVGFGFVSGLTDMGPELSGGWKGSRAEHSWALRGWSDSIQSDTFSSVTQATLAALASTNYYENGFTFVASGNAACFQLWEGYFQCLYMSHIRATSTYLHSYLGSEAIIGSMRFTCSADSDVACFFTAVAALITLNYLMENILWK